MAKLAAAIQDYREWTGLSQRELGERIGLEHSSVSKLEKGQRMPSMWILENLARAGVITIFISKSGTQIKAVKSEQNKSPDHQPAPGGPGASSGVRPLPGGSA